MDEFRATVSWAQNPSHGLGWHATVGPLVLAVHMNPNRWGWNARGASRQWLAVEFAQATVQDGIDDEQVATFAWWFAHVARRYWPELPAVFPTHAELPEGQQDGKSDVFPRGDLRADQLRERIRARLRLLGVT